MRNRFARVSDPHDFVSEPGDRFRKIYSSLLLPDGRIELQESDRMDIQQMINSHRDSTDMAFILKRLQLGDSSVLSASPGSYADITDAPTSLAEVLQLGLDAERRFLELPVSVRQQFDNDYRKWFSTAGTDRWMRTMFPDAFKPENSSDPEVTSNES